MVSLNDWGELEFPLDEWIEGSFLRGSVLRHVKLFGAIVVLVAAVIGAGLAGLQIYLQGCPSCGSVGLWSQIDVRRFGVQAHYRQCECGLIQISEKRWGFETGTASGLPPLRMGTLEQVKQLRQLISSKGGTTDGATWILENQGRLRQKEIETVVDWSKVSVVERMDVPFREPCTFSAIIPVTEHYQLRLSWNEVDPVSSFDAPAKIETPVSRVELRYVAEPQSESMIGLAELFPWNNHFSRWREETGP